VEEILQFDLHLATAHVQIASGNGISIPARPNSVSIAHR
jgi:hypothetical protein